CFEGFGAEVLKTNSQIIFTKVGLGEIGSAQIHLLPHQSRALRHRTEQPVAPLQDGTSMFAELILILRKSHVAGVAQNMDEFELLELSIQKRQQIDATRRFPTPAGGSAPLRFRNVPR